MAAAALVALAGCSGDTAGTEEGASVKDIQSAADDERVQSKATENNPAYEGPHGDEFLPKNLDSYDGETVTVSAKVNRAIADQVFTIAGRGGIEELLVLSEDRRGDLKKGDVVEVTGVVHQTFDAPMVDDYITVDPQQQLYADYEGEPYIEATRVRVE